jgi:hypothetical protein
MIDAIELIRASRSTSKQHFRHMTEHDDLEQYGRALAVRYALK